MICPECGQDRNAEPVDQSEVCYCRTDRRRNPVISEIVTREAIREQLAEVLGVNPAGAIGFRMTERVLTHNWM